MLDAREVYRILKPGGLFITQQVGGRNNEDLSRKVLGEHTPAYPDHDLEHNVALLLDAGFSILRAEEAFPPIRFFDLGTLVYFAKVIQWEFPGFSVDRCFERLCRLQDELEERGYIEGTEHRFLIVATKD